MGVIPMAVASLEIPLRYRPLWQAIGGLLIVLVAYESLMRNPTEIPVPHGDTYGHTFAYATLMFWFSSIHAHAIARSAWAFTFMSLGVALEYAQGLTDYRSCDVSDMAANGLGICIGWLLAPPRSPHMLRFLEARMA
jgi:VanZ family protein